MSYINVGASDGFKTKKALKEALAADPSKVHFYGTSPFTPFSGTVLDLQPGDSLQVVGPDPYTSRKWFAGVKVENGNVKIT